MKDLIDKQTGKGVVEFFLQLLLHELVDLDLI